MLRVMVIVNNVITDGYPHCVLVHVGNKNILPLSDDLHSAHDMRIQTEKYILHFTVRLK